MAINLSRNTRVWVSTVKTGHNNNNTFEIPIQEDYTLAQPVGSTDIGIEEAGAEPTRGSKRFNTNLDPVDWGFSTYFNPYLLLDADTTPKEFHFTTDMLLWHALASGDSATVDLDDSNFDSDAAEVRGTSEVYGSTAGFKVGFGNNSAHVLTKLYLYFKIDNEVYLVEDAQVGQAEISVDISDLGMTAWSGNATKFSRIAAPAFMSGTGLPYNTEAPTTDEFVAVPSNQVYMINKLTEMSFQSDVSGTNKYYKVPITGASLTIANNITFLTPNTLAKVDVPVGSFTGAFEVSGSLEAYMRDTGNDGSTELLARGTTELLEDMTNNLSEVTNTTNITFSIGGQSGPRVVVNVPTAHIAVPTLDVQDVVSTSIEFKAIPNDPNMKSGTELSMEFHAK